MIDTFDVFGPRKLDENVEEAALAVVGAETGAEIFGSSVMFYRRILSSIITNIAQTTEIDDLRDLVSRSNTQMRDDARYHFGHFQLSPDEARAFFIIEPIGEIMAAAMMIYAKPTTSPKARDYLTYIVSSLHAAGKEAAKKITRQDLSTRALEQLNAMGLLMSTQFKVNKTIH